MTIALTINETRAKLESFGQIDPFQPEVPPQPPSTRWIGFQTDLQAGFMIIPINADPFQVDTVATLLTNVPITVGETTLHLSSVEFQAEPDAIKLNFDAAWPEDSVEYGVRGATAIDWSNGFPSSEGIWTAPTTLESAYLGSQANEVNPGMRVTVHSIPEASQCLCLLATLAAAALMRWWRG